jgi:hypothetical protein
VFDLRNKTQALLWKNSLRDQQFDLLAWKRSAFGLTATHSNDSDYDFLSVDDTETEVEFSDISDDDIPDLQSVSDSEDEIEIEAPLHHPGHAEETFEDRLSTIRRVLADDGEIYEREAVSRHQLGDVLGQSAQAFLEFLQPYPGDDVVPRDDARRSCNRFEVIRGTNGDFSIKDAYLGIETALPASYLMTPAFHLASWYSQVIVDRFGLTYNRPPLHRVAVEELLVYAVQQYIDRLAEDLPELDGVTVQRLVNEPDVECERELFVVSIPFNGYKIYDLINDEDFSTQLGRLDRKTQAQILYD